MEKVAIADQIIQRQDKDGMLRRALERIIQLYTDKSHFVYELLQNAEDTGASKIKFEQYPDRLEVFHDGHPFTLDNLQGLCDIGKSDKTEDLNQIGEFGVGFKSVFAICETVRLYSHPRADEEAEYDQYAVEIKDFTHPVEIEDQDLDAAYTTKFVFPYSVGHAFSGFDTLEQLNLKLSKRLQDLGITTLLFMKNLQSIDYKIELQNFKTSGAYELNKMPFNDHYALVSAIGKQDSDKENKEISYLVFSREVSGIQEGRTIDIAFAVKVDENGEYIFEEAKHPYVSVYFPTEKESKLKFIVQGPYRTTPNRSSVPAEDSANMDLAEQTAELLSSSVFELRDSGKLNYSFLNILPLDDAVFDNAPLFKRMADYTEDLLKDQALFLCKDGSYAMADSVKIARGTDLTKVFPEETYTELLNDGTMYHWLPEFITENSRTYKELYEYLRNVLGIEIVRPENLRDAFNSNKTFLLKQDNEWLVKMYNMYDVVGSAFINKKGVANMATAEIIKTTKGTFVAPYRRVDESESITFGNSEREMSSYLPNVFLPTSNMDEIENISFVDEDILKNCQHFFIDVLHLQKPNTYEFFVQDFIRRYESGSGISKKQHIADIRRITHYLSIDDYHDEISSLIKKYITVRCSRDGKIVYKNPSNVKVYFPVNSDGMCIELYYEHIVIHPYVDLNYYEKEGINANTLKLLGVSEEVATGLDEIAGKHDTGKPGRQPMWETDGDFRWKLNLDNLDSVLEYIASHPSASDSMAKSSFIFRFLQNHEDMLTGTVYISGDHPDIEGAYADIVRKLRRDNPKNQFHWTDKQSGKWLFTKTGELAFQKDITKHDLDTQLYGELIPGSKLYEILGFAEGAEDRMEAAAKKYDLLDDDTKGQYFEIELQRRYGISPLDLEENIVSGMDITMPIHSQQENYDFPSAKVKNWDSLRKHVAEVLVFASPVNYEYKVRHIRVSRPTSEIDAYLRSMYRIEGTNKYACQMCHEPMERFVRCQLPPAMEIELEALNLCMCPNCATEYKSIRFNEAAMQGFLDKIMEMDERDINSNEPVKIDLGSNSIWFTQTHIAEIKELMALKAAADNLKENENISNEQSNGIKNDYNKICAESEMEEDLGAEEVVAGTNVYKEYVGKKIYHKKEGHGIVTACDGIHISIEYEEGTKAGKVIKYSLEKCLSDDLLKLV